MSSRTSAQLRILVYSDNPRTREQVQLALGKRVHPELPELTYVEVATGAMVVRQMDAGGFDLVILDGEANGYRQTAQRRGRGLPAGAGPDRAPR
jgi:CheY-like chemotaxis protein